MRRRVHLAGLLLLAPALLLASAEVPAVPVDPKIEGWLHRIELSSERGDLGTVLKLRMELADYAALAHRYNVAARQYEMLLVARPGRKERVRLFIRLGNVRMALEDYSHAITAFDDALHDNPKDWEANLQRARAFAAIDMNQRSIESYQRCIKLKATEGAPYAELGQVYEKQGFLGKALVSYQKALLIEPRPEIYLHMADCYVHLNNIARAIEVLSQAKARLPSAEYDVRLGDIYYGLGDMARACAAWEDAVKADPARDDVRLQLSQIYDQLHRRNDADHQFKQLLAAYPDSPLVHFCRAMVLWKRGERSASRDEALIVQTLSPTELIAHYNDLLLAQNRKSQ